MTQIQLSGLSTSIYKASSYSLLDEWHWFGVWCIEVRLKSIVISHQHGVIRWLSSLCFSLANRASVVEYLVC